MNAFLYEHPDDVGVVNHEDADLTGDVLPDEDGWEIGDIVLEDIVDESEPPT